MTLVGLILIFEVCFYLRENLEIRLLCVLPDTKNILNMRVCVFCKTRYQKGSGITFHKFPSDSTKQLWLKNMKMENFILKSNDHICSQHFTKDCFIKHASRTSLKNGSIPVIFFVNTPSVCDGMDNLTPGASESVEVKKEWSSIDHENIDLDEASTSGSQKKSWTAPIVCENVKHEHLYENASTKSVSEVCANIKHDHLYENTHRSTKKNLQRVKKSLYLSRARIKALSQHVKRLKITVSYLKTVIKNLRKKKLIDDDCLNMLEQYHDFRPELFKRILKNTGHNIDRSKYPPALR